MDPGLASYWALIQAFVEGRLSVPEFASVYRTLCKNEPRKWPSDIADILGRLLTDVDTFASDAFSRDARGPDGPQVEHLRKRAAEALHGLEKALNAG